MGPGFVPPFFALAETPAGGRRRVGFAHPPAAGQARQRACFSVRGPRPRTEKRRRALVAPKGRCGGRRRLAAEGRPWGPPLGLPNKQPGPEALPPARAFQGASRPAAAPLRWVFRRRQGRMKFPGLSSIQLRSARTIPPGKAAAHTLRAAAEQSPCRGLLRGGAFTPSCANLAVGAAQKRDRKTGLFRLLLVGD